jgi:hypothetical protein
MTVMAALMSTALSVSANTIFDTNPAADEMISTVIQVSPSDVATDPITSLFGTSAIGTLDDAASFHPDDADLLSSEFLSLQPGSFPPHLYGTQGILDAVPEPTSAPWLTCGFLTIAWIGRRKRT